jgi:hypothetical protein
MTANDLGTNNKKMRVTCYLLVALAITISVTVSIIEILR